VQLAGEDEQNLFAGGPVSHTLQVRRDRELPCAQLAAAARGTDVGQEAAGVRLERHCVATALQPGDVVLVPAGSDLRVDAGPEGATACVTTTPGLEAVTADGTKIAPPWAQ